MQIEIFTEDSGTTADPESVEQVKDYFKGGFLPVMDLHPDQNRLEILLLGNTYNEHIRLHKQEL